MPKLLVKYGCSCWNSQFWVWKVAAPLGPRFSPNWSSWKTCCLWCLFQHSFRFLEKKGIKKVNLGKKPYSVYCRDKIVFCHKTLLFSTCSLKWHLVYTISVVGSACLFSDYPLPALRQECGLVGLRSPSLWDAGGPASFWRRRRRRVVRSHHRPQRLVPKVYVKRSQRDMQGFPCQESKESSG